jgi:hypothetical protein
MQRERSRSGASLSGVSLLSPRDAPSERMGMDRHWLLPWHKTGLNDHGQHFRATCRAADKKKTAREELMSMLSRRHIVAASTLLGACVASRPAWPAGPDERFDLSKVSEG